MWLSQYQRRCRVKLPPSLAVTSPHAGVVRKVAGRCVVSETLCQYLRGAAVTVIQQLRTLR